MNAADYLARADTLYAMAQDADGPDYTHQRTNLILGALVAAVCAVAVELGVPPVSPVTSGGGRG